MLQRIFKLRDFKICSILRLTSALKVLDILPEDLAAYIRWPAYRILEIQGIVFTLKLSGHLTQCGLRGMQRCRDDLDGGEGVGEAGVASCLNSRGLFFILKAPLPGSSRAC